MRKEVKFKLVSAAVIICTAFSGIAFGGAGKLEFIKVSPDGKKFILAESGKRWFAMGFNYDHDGPGRLIEDYWYNEWPTVVQDFDEMKELGANVVRIHLQTSKFMDSPTEPNKPAIRQLVKLMDMAEEKGLYLDLTGLACYHMQNTPKWYSDMNEPQRWAVQARFWEAIAHTCAGRSVVFCYDLMNEPVTGRKAEDKNSDPWMEGAAYGGEYFVQRIALDMAGRTQKQIAQAWIDTLVKAIRKYDTKHMVTVGAIPWAFMLHAGKPVIETCDNIDFVSVHYYPNGGQIDWALEALKMYNLGKPLVCEEFFSLNSSVEDIEYFIDESRPLVDGYICFYSGQTIDDLKKSNYLASLICETYYRFFKYKVSQLAISLDPNASLK